VARRSKRVNGDGSVYRRDSGYEAAITVAGKRKTARGGSRTEAEAALRRLRALRDTGQLPRRDDTTTADYLGYWLLNRKPHLVYSTWRRYRELVDLHAIPIIGHIPLVKVNALHLDDLYSKRLACGLSSQTVLHLHRVLHKALHDAESWDLLDRNPAAKATAPKVRHTEPNVFTPAECVKFVTAAQKDPFGAAFVLGLTAGLREGELLGLQWSDLDLRQTQTAQISRAMVRAESGRTLGGTKTEKSDRRIEVLDVARDLLLSHRQQQNAWRLAADGWSGSSLVFTDEAGASLNPDRLRRRFRAFLASQDLPLLPFKNLRHTFATLHLETGASDKVVSEALGHSRTSTTNQYYRRVDRRHQRKMALGLAALLQPPAPEHVAGGIAGGTAEANASVKAG